MTTVRNEKGKFQKKTEVENFKKDQPVNPRLAEIMKCSEDALYFIKNYCMIQHPQRGSIKLEPYPYQEDCIKAFQTNSKNIVLKSRQLGLSTITSAFVTWFSVFNQDKNILIVAIDFKTAANFLKKVKYMINKLPKILQFFHIKSENKDSITLSNGSVIKAVASTENAGRSEALSMLIMDEAAFIADFDKIWTAALPTLSTGGGAIIISTPNSASGLYYDLWMAAIEKRNSFNTIKLPWNVHPEHDEKWFQQQAADLGSPKKVAQELLCDFLTSGDTFLQPETMTYLNSTIREPLRYEGTKAEIYIWKEPEPGHEYLISADVARGDSADYSGFLVLDLQTGEFVCEYMGKVFPDVFAELLMEYGEHYNNALVCPESNTFGNHVIIELGKMGYTRLFYPNMKKGMMDYYRPSPDDKAGFSNQRASRIEAMTRLEDLFRRNVISSNSKRLYKQLQSFVWIKDKPQSQKGTNDDLVLCAAISAYVYSKYYPELSTVHRKDNGIKKSTISPIVGIFSQKQTFTAQIPRYNLQRPVNSSFARTTELDGVYKQLLEKELFEK